jgi:hypothetical protein
MRFRHRELRAEGHAQADLAGAAGDDVRHDAVDADGGEDEREDAEAAERDRGHARGEERGAHVLGERFRAEDRKGGIELLHGVAEAVQRGLRVAAGAGDERDVAAVVPEQGPVDGGLRIFA